MMTAFEILTVPATDTYAIRYAAAKRRGELSGLLSREGSLASALRRSTLSPRRTKFDDCCSIGVEGRRAADALRALLDRRGWTYREYKAEYLSSNHGQFFREVTDVA